MSMKPRLFGTKKPDGPDPGRIQRTLQNSVTAIASRTDHQNMTRAERAKVYREAAVAYDSGYRRKGIVLDYTSKGVRLRFPTNESLPPRFISMLAPSALRDLPGSSGKADQKPGLRWTADPSFRPLLAY
jgi:hypothetical protein